MGVALAIVSGKRSRMLLCCIVVSHASLCHGLLSTWRTFLTVLSWLPLVAELSENLKNSVMLICGAR